MAVLALVVFVGLFFGLLRNIEKARAGDDMHILPLVDEEFRQLVVDGSIPERDFDGSRVSIVNEFQEKFHDEGSGTATLLSVQRWARNEHGEYFFFFSDGTGQPLLKHISHAAAQAALKAKYIAPPQITRCS